MNNPLVIHQDRAGDMLISFRSFAVYATEHKCDIQLIVSGSGLPDEIFNITVTKEKADE